MRAVIHHQFGEPADVLGVEEVETPTPGPGEVRLRVTLSPIHNHDLWTVRGTYGFTPELPARAGTEAVGVVDAVGEGVSLEIGRRVATGGTFGVWAEYVIAPAAGLIPVSDSLSDEMAAQLVAMPFSAISLLHSLDLKPGDVIVQNTANGAVGRMVAQIARAVASVSSVWCAARAPWRSSPSRVSATSCPRTPTTGATPPSRSRTARRSSRASIRWAGRRATTCCRC